MPKRKNDLTNELRSVVDEMVTRLQEILDSQLQAQFESFLSERGGSTPARRKPGRPPGKKAGSKKAAAARKGRKSGRAKSEDVAAAALDFLKSASGPVSINEISDATGFQLAQLRNAIGILIERGEASKTGKARAVRYSAGKSGKAAPAKKRAAKKKKTTTRKKKAAPKKKAAAKKKPATKRKAAPKKKGVTKRRPSTSKGSSTAKKAPPKKPAAPRTEEGTKSE